MALAGPGWDIVARVAGQSLTIAVGFIRAILAVGLTITAQAQVHTLASSTGELGGRAHWAAFLITLVGTLGEAITAPGSGDAVNLTSGTGKLIRGAGRRLWEREESTVTQAHLSEPHNCRKPIAHFHVVGGLQTY